MTDFMGVALLVTGIVIVGISLYKSRHSKSSSSLDIIRHGMSSQHVEKILAVPPKRADANLGLYFGLIFMAVGVIRILFVWWFWSHLPG